MAVYQTRPWRRGDIYYIGFDNSVGSEQGIGRPGIIVTLDSGCATSPVLNVVYLTTREGAENTNINVEINATGRRSWALCNQIFTVDKIRFKNYKATASEDEMARVDRALATALGIPFGIINDTSEIDAARAEVELAKAELAKTESDRFTLMAERDYYKRLYDAALGRFVSDRLEIDMKPRAVRAPRLVPDEPEEEEPAPVTEEPTEEKIDLNTCSAGDLKRAGLKEEVIVRIMDARPFAKAEDLRQVQGITKVAWQLLQHKVTVGTHNINELTGKEIANALGIGETTGYTISGYRNKNGPYKSMEELLNVPRITEKVYEKACKVLTV